MSQTAGMEIATLILLLGAAALAGMAVALKARRASK